MHNSRLSLIISFVLAFTITVTGQIIIGPSSGSGGSGGSGTVTQIDTTSPITGGPITTTGTLACATCGITSNPLSQFASTTSAQLAGIISNESGSGLLVFNDTPTFIAPLLGTPTSGTLTNATGLPISTGISGLAAGIATWLATPSSANLLAALTDETGTGLAVFSTSPVFSTNIDLDSAGVRASAADGVLTLLGLGNGSDENLTIDLDNAGADTVNIGTGTGVFHYNWITASVDDFADFTFSNPSAGATGGLTVGVVRNGVGVGVFSGNDTSGQRSTVSSTLAFAGLQIHTQNANPINLATNNTDRWTIESNGYFTDLSAVPAVSNTSANSCGTTAATIVGSNTAGKVTVGATSGISCTVTFTETWPTAPSCTVSNETTANLTRATSTTTTTILAGTFAAGDILAYQCQGYN